MLCEICRKREAKLNITKTLNGKTVRVSICYECLADINRSEHVANEKFNAVNIPDKRCRVCGRSWSEISSDLIVGCPYCYTEFSKELKPIIDKVQKL